MICTEHPTGTQLPKIPTWFSSLLLLSVFSAICSPCSGIILQGPQCLQEHLKQPQGRGLFVEICRTRAWLSWSCAAKGPQADPSGALYCSLHPPFSSTVAQPWDTIVYSLHVVQLWRIPLRVDNRMGFFSKTIATWSPNLRTRMIVIW